MKNEFTSDSFYLFRKHGTTHPFCIDASKQSFFFLSLSLFIIYSTCPTTMFEFYKSIYDRPTLLVCSPHFRYRLSFFEIRLFLPWNCVLIQQIYLSIRRIENWNVDECDFDSRNDPVFTDSRRPLLIEFQSRGALAPRPEKAFKPITILEFPAAARVSSGEG